MVLLGGDLHPPARVEDYRWHRHVAKVLCRGSLNGFVASQISLQLPVGAMFKLIDGRELNAKKTARR